MRKDLPNVMQKTVKRAKDTAWFSDPGPGLLLFNHTVSTCVFQERRQLRCGCHSMAEHALKRVHLNPSSASVPLKGHSLFKEALSPFKGTSAQDRDRVETVFAVQGGGHQHIMGTGDHISWRIIEVKMDLDADYKFKLSQLKLLTKTKTGSFFTIHL